MEACIKSLQSIGRFSITFFIVCLFVDFAGDTDLQAPFRNDQHSFSALAVSEVYAELLVCL